MPDLNTLSEHHGHLTNRSKYYCSRLAVSKQVFGNFAVQ